MEAFFWGTRFSENLFGFYIFWESFYISSGTTLSFIPVWGIPNNSPKFYIFLIPNLKCFKPCGVNSVFTKSIRNWKLICHSKPGQKQRINERYTLHQLGKSLKKDFKVIVLQAQDKMCCWNGALPDVGKVLIQEYEEQHRISRFTAAIVRWEVYADIHVQVNVLFQINNFLS